MLTAHLVADIRAAEESLAATLPEGELMRRAARGLADHLELIPAGDVVVILVGPGNNGGDALYAAVHLRDRGVRVDLCLLDEKKVHAEGLAAALAAGAQIVDEPTQQRWCLDAIFGIGARPGLEGKAAEWLAWIDREEPYVIAVDVPSGVDVDGATLPTDDEDLVFTVRASKTITFGAYKPCLLVGPAADHADAGIPELVDIGLEPHLPERPAIQAIEVTEGFGPPGLGGQIDKYARGVLGVAAGSAEYAGAAHLCVAGAQAGGFAGMIRFVGSPELSKRVVDRAPEVVAGHGRVQAWVVGPGGGRNAKTQLGVALKARRPVVVDASALVHIPERFPSAAVLTPHSGELAKMMDTSRDAVDANPLWHVEEAAARWDCTVLLKGKRTLIAHPGQPTRVNLSGTQWLATAGAGDVLAGLIGSIVAGGWHSYEAASHAAFIHGAAAVRANPGGPITASMVAAEIPGVIADFMAGTLGDVRDWRD